MIEYDYLFQYFGRMKKYAILAFLSFGFLTAFGQFQSASEEISFFKQRLNIEKDQEQKLEKVINRKYEDLASIAVLRNSDEKVFRQKRRSIFEGTNSSIRLMMKEQQMDLWVAYKKEERLKNAKKIKELKASGASEDDLLDAQIGIIE